MIRMSSPDRGRVDRSMISSAARRTAPTSRLPHASVSEKIDVSAHISDLNLRLQETLGATVDGDLTLFGPPLEPVLGGNLILSQMKYTEDLELEKSLLNFSRTSPTEFVTVDLNKVIRETLTLVEHQLQKAGVQVTLSLDEKLPRINGNPGKLQQVFLNLVLNARDDSLAAPGLEPARNRLLQAARLVRDRPGPLLAHIARDAAQDLPSWRQRGLHDQGHPRPF